MIIIIVIIYLCFLIYSIKYDKYPYKDYYGSTKIIINNKNNLY